MARSLNLAIADRSLLGQISQLLVGGVSEKQTIVDGPIAAIEAEIKDAIEQTNGRRLLVGPGCVIPTNTPVEHIQAARAAVEM